MKALKLLSVFLLLVLMQTLFADEIMLQNGLNGYDGCVDASILNDGTGNTGTSEKLAIEFENC